MKKPAFFHDVRIELNASRCYRDEAARLYAEAFLPKIEPILGPPERAVPFLAEGFRPERAFLALRGEHVLGIAGFKLAGRGAFYRSSRDFFTVYGWSALFRLGLGILLEREENAEELLMDGIAVAPEARGQGIGTAMLAAICDHARKVGKRAVRLDVINTNPGARKLYEREGFVAGDTTELEILGLLFPFQSATTMLRSV